MKNLMFAAVLSLGTMTAFAQEENAVEETNTAVEESATNTTEAVEENATETSTTSEDFSEVAADELPESITAAVSKNYPTASIDKAYVNEANQYKLEVSLEDGTAGTLYADENGNWIEM